MTGKNTEEALSAEAAKERDVKVRAAYADATKSLRERHREEFDALLQGNYKNAGVTVKVRLTPEQRQAAKDAVIAERERKVREKKAEQLAEMRAMIAVLEAEIATEVATSGEPEKPLAGVTDLFSTGTDDPF